MNLNNNTILITGGTSGIGLAFAGELYKLGNKVIICGRREDRLKKLSEKYPGMIIKICDVSKEKDRIELAGWVISNFGDINILINNAGVQLAYNVHNPDEIKKVYDETETNFVAPVHLSSLFVNHLKKKENPAIINITSGLAFVPLSFMPVYCATKAGLHSFTLSLRHQLKDTPIKVFEIAPPAVDTELGHQGRKDKNQSHGGIPVEEFLKEAMEALKNDVFEAMIANAKVLREKNEQLFEQMNSR
ncbi:MAG: SDR family NAD(P)-dependent oxidoreductase [Ignavibacteriae bacterium]|nr:SDR family NAD(P)-dependent oxidoreductase [Ignavibacteriota bacterium]